MTRLASRVEHRDWGLEAPVEDDRHWLTEISCRLSDPTLWEVHGQSISKENRYALNICAGCVHGRLGVGGRCEQAARTPNLANSGYRTDGVIMAGALWKEGVPFIPSRCPRCNRPYLWRWQAGAMPDHICPVRKVEAEQTPKTWNVLAA